MSTELQNHLNTLFNACQRAPMPAKEHVACQTAVQAIAAALQTSPAALPATAANGHAPEASRLTEPAATA